MNPDELTRIGHDPGAFEAFYRDHVEAIQRFGVRRVDDPHLAGRGWARRAPADHHL